MLGSGREALRGGGAVGKAVAGSCSPTPTPLLPKGGLSCARTSVESFAHPGSCAYVSQNFM